MMAAKLAPSEVRSQIYQQAAQKAIDEGNTDRALQIANDHLEGPGQEAITRAVELKRTPDATKLKKAREMLAALPSDSARVRALISVAIATEKDNPQLAVAFLNIARDIVSKKAINYEDFENQLKVADAFAALDIKSSFDMLEWGIPQLNEILAAAAIVNGFEAEVFRDGELPLQGGSELGNMLARYGSELASLARIDFARARIAADKSQLPESRLLAKLLIVQHVLGNKASNQPPH